MPRIAGQAGPVIAGAGTYADVHLAAAVDQVGRVLGTQAPGLRAVDHRHDPPSLRPAHQGLRRPASVTESLEKNARRAAVISSPDLGVFAVAAEGVLCAFCCVLDPLPEHCLRRRRPGQARRRQEGFR